MTARDRPHSSTGFASGWGPLLIVSFARAYLAFLLSLAFMALLPSLMGWQGTVVQSGSMEPHISTGDVVLLSELQQEMPVPMGGVVSFRTETGSGGDPERAVLHRIVAANQDGTFVTAGDANAVVDSTPLGRERITGQARLLVPYVGLPGYWLGTGHLPALAIWSVATLAALVAVALSIPGRFRSTDPPSHGDPNPDLVAQQVPAAAGSGLSRRNLLSAVPLLALPAAAATAFGARPIDAYFSGRAANSGNSWQAAASFGSRMYNNYRAVIAPDSPWAYYPLDEAPSIFVAQDASGNNRDAMYSYFGVTNSVPGALTGETNFAITHSGTPTSTFSTPGPIPGPQAFTIELWFRTGSGQGGELAGFGDTRTGASGRYDRNLYMGSDGKLNFGTYTGVTHVITSPASYNDSVWHHVAATLGPAGMALYIDGQLVGSNPNRAAESYNGYWRIGGDNLAGWPNRPTNTYFTGSLDEIAIYPAPLSATRIGAHHRAALATTTGNYAVEVLADAPGYHYHLEEGGPGALVDSSGNRRDTTYPSGGVTYSVPGPLTKMNNRAAQFDGSGGSLITATRHDNPQTFSIEAWFNTTTDQGGQIIGFANNTSITSVSRHDRTVFMLNSGHLAFGIRPNTRRAIFTDSQYNDGAWHHVVASLSTNGMFLYVDGELLASDTRWTHTDAYSGHWQIGAGQLANWPARPTSNYFAGRLDEVAVYTSALTPAQVRVHYSAQSDG
ncbi:signal peptidase I [Arthrobacter sp. EH-1B-1]|uniref:Signal peptidase I n=1 Tax=Arthrobacter vasquezii TaxID=2977629 RepID=A0ABT6CYA8_9MICC|nr:signal peptidase I [Arthrobacter vasquezii]MDF9279079.1 signal peptidase I [Arthrobacter vasquezii]